MIGNRDLCDDIGEWKTHICSADGIEEMYRVFNSDSDGKKQFQDGKIGKLDFSRYMLTHANDVRTVVHFS